MEPDSITHLQHKVTFQLCKDFLENKVTQSHVDREEGEEERRERKEQPYIFFFVSQLIYNMGVIGIL